MAGSNRPLPKPRIQYGLHANAAGIMAQADARASAMLMQGLTNMGNHISTGIQGKKRRQAAERMQQKNLDADAARYNASNRLAAGKGVLQFRLKAATDLQDRIDKKRQWGGDTTADEQALNNLVNQMGNVGAGMAGAAVPLQEAPDCPPGSG